MTDDLRTLIAAVLNAELKNQADERNGWHESWDSSSLADVEIDDLDLNALADAVIRELGLTQHHAVEDRGGSKRKVTRYVTDWRADG